MAHCLCGWGKTVVIRAFSGSGEGGVSFSGGAPQWYRGTALLEPCPAALGEGVSLCDPPFHLLFLEEHRVDLPSERFFRLQESGYQAVFIHLSDDEEIDVAPGTGLPAGEGTVDEDGVTLPEVVGVLPDDPGHPLRS